MSIRDPRGTRSRESWNTQHAPRRIYQQAGEGKAPTVSGIGQPYEAPSNPEIVLDTTKYSPVESAQEVLKRISCG